MKKKNAYLLLIIAIVTLTSFTKFDDTPSDKVVIYGIVFSKKCKIEVSTYYQIGFVNLENIKQAKEDLRKELEESITDFTKIEIFDSRSDYGKKATHLCVISWIEKVDECRYTVYKVIFGKSEQNALDNAIKYKNKKAGLKTEYQIEDQLYF